MRDVIITLIVFGGIPFILRKPHVGILFYSWISYMNPHRLTWGFAYSMPFAAVLAGTTMLAMIFSKESKKIPINSLTVIWFFWIVWMNVTTFFALVPEEAHIKWDRSIKIQLMTIITMMLIKTQERINALIWVLVFSIGFYGVKGGIFTILTGGNMLVWGPPDTYFSGNNGLAVALIMIFPLLYYNYTCTSNKWIKRLIIISAPLMGLSILSTYSRGAFLAIAAVALYWTYKGKKKHVVIPLIFVAGLAGLAFMPDKYFDRMGTIQTYEEDGSAMGRINAWYFAYHLANDRPLVGGGFNTFDRNLFLKYAPEPDDFHDAHSIYFEVLGEQGYVGLILFLLLGGLALQHGNQIRKLTKERSDLKWAFDLATMLQIGMVGYAVGGAFLGLAYFDLYYHLISMLVVTKAVIEEKLKQEKSVVGDDIKLNSVSAVGVKTPNINQY